MASEGSGSSGGLDISVPSISEDSLNESFNTGRFDSTELIVVQQLKLEDDEAGNEGQTEELLENVAEQDRSLLNLEESGSKVIIDDDSGSLLAAPPSVNPAAATPQAAETEAEKPAVEKGTRGRRGSVFESLTPEELKKRMKNSSLDQKEFLNFSKWIVCFCVVAFDIEIGQALEHVYPPVELTEREKSDIRVTAFPDSNTGVSGDVDFVFRLRKDNVPLIPGLPATMVASKKYSHLYGYTLFRQRKDESLKRGYFQKSVLLLTFHPFDGLFKEMVRMIGPSYFDLGPPLFEAVCLNIASWAPPVPGRSYELPFLGRLLQLEMPPPSLPSDWQPPKHPKRDDNSINVNIRLHSEKIYRTFHEILPELWLCWELVLLGEPIAVFSPSPSQGSDAVLALASIINPIPYSGDIRPYFTVQDSDYKEFTTKTKPASNVIIGVTNPYFVKALEHWPHMVSLGSSKKSSPSKRMSSLDIPQGVKTKYEAYIRPEKKILKQVDENKGNPTACEEILEQHFVELTQSFLLPLERYFQTLVPSSRSISPWKAVPRVKPFQVDVFLKSLRDMGPQLPILSKGKTEWVDFYRRFLKTTNFKSWFRARVRQADRGLKKFYLKVLCEADVKTWVVGKHDIELVDFMIRLQDELKSPKVLEIMDPKQVPILEGHIKVIIDGLPEDLRLSILQTAEAQQEAEMTEGK